METRLDCHSLDGEARDGNEVKTVGRTNIDQVVSFMLFQSVTFCTTRISEFLKHVSAMNLVRLSLS